MSMNDPRNRGPRRGVRRGPGMNGGQGGMRMPQSSLPQDVEVLSEADLAAEGEDLRAHPLDHGDEPEGADMRLGHPEDFLRRAGLDEFGQHPEAFVRFWLFPGVKASRVGLQQQHDTIFPVLEKILFGNFSDSYGRISDDEIIAFAAMQNNPVIAVRC